MSSIRPWSLSLLALCAGLLVLGAACSGDDDSDSNGMTQTLPPGAVDFDGDGDPVYDPADVRALCNVLTRDEVEAILQTGISAMQALRMADGVACSWYIDYTLEELEDGGPVQVRFYTEGGRAAFDTKKAEAETTDVTDLGQAAYLTDGGRSLYVLTGEETAFFLLDGSFLRAWERPEDWQRELATAVIEGLP